MEDFAALNNRVNIKDFQIPEEFDLDTVVSAITTVSMISSFISDNLTSLMCYCCFSMRKDLIDSLMWDSQPIRSFLIVDNVHLCQLPPHSLI